tara:strand:+ start:438 stop:1625 length:1188 start_codon:yes stop_codon:yes gene_type:complete
MINREKCASCYSDNFSVVYNFGDIPLAGSFPLEADRNNIKKYPLSIIMCNDCKLVQTDTLIDPKILFKDYRYISSVGMQKHFNSYADWLIDNENITNDTQILEFGCNDGPLLYALKERGINNTIGIDPATNIVELGRKKNLNLIDDFFNYGFVKKKKWINKYDFILASNTFAHITDINSVVKGIEYSLKKDGKFIFEVQYLLDLVDKFQFDFMYHEHLYYYTVTSLKHLLSKHNLKIVDVEKIPTHSGSIRITATKDLTIKVNPKVSEFIEKEKSYEDLSNFSNSIETSLQELKKFLKDNQDKKIIGYGASGRANVVIGTLDLDNTDVDYIIDESPERYNRYTSNGKIPIHPPSHIDKADYILIFAWNFADMIIEKTKHLGIPYVIPFPQIKIIK